MEMEERKKAKRQQMVNHKSEKCKLIKLKRKNGKGKRNKCKNIIINNYTNN